MHVAADFLRVGALRRIDKRLLGNSLHATESKSKSDAVAELKDMLAQATSRAEAATIAAELQAAQQVSWESSACTAMQCCCRR